MRVARARKRWYAWKAYQTMCQDLTENTLNAPPVYPYHQGFIKAHWDYTHAKRWAPKGLRDIRLW